MEWLQENYGVLCAIFTALYAAIRGIVALTPTPKDDAKLSEVAGWLKSLASIMGLDLKQGVNTDDKSSTTTTYSSLLILLFVIPVLSCSGCGVFDDSPKAKYVAARQVYVSIVEKLVEMRLDGKFTRSQADEITVAIDAVGSALDEWEVAIIAGADIAEPATAFKVAIAGLIELKDTY